VVVSRDLLRSALRLQAEEELARREEVVRLGTYNRSQMYMGVQL
jgi:hypothetical protein